jgi:hypothetical protein
VGQAVGAEFLQRLQDGEFEEAWESTTVEFKSAQGKESFVKRVRPLKFLKQPLDFVSAQPVSLGQESRTEYLFGAHGGQTVRIVLGREDGFWKVDHWSCATTE